VNSEIIKLDYDVKSLIKAIESNRMISSKLIPILEKGY
jgi:hypothetical protein